MHNFFRKSALVILTLAALTGISGSFASEETSFQQGNEYFRQKQYDKAIENLSISVKLQRNDFLAEALIQIAATYYEQKDYANALTLYQDALKENPDKKENSSRKKPEYWY